jgi:hypothetical protein
MSTTSRLSGTLPRSRPESTGPLVCGVGSCEKPAVHRYPAAMARRAQASLPGFAEEMSQIFVALLAKRSDVKPRGWKAAKKSKSEFSL